MDRNDLFTEEALPIVSDINNLIRMLYSKNLSMTSWYGTLPGSERPAREGGVKAKLKGILDKLSNKHVPSVCVGKRNRGPDYEALPGAEDDNRIPWYLYWEIVWVLTKGPTLKKTDRLLDAGGTASLFTCYMASLGFEVHSIDLKEHLISTGNHISKKMGWNMHSYAMNMKKLDFPDNHFDHAFSICVFEHLDYEVKQSALAEISRVLKPGGVLSITFDFRNPAPAVVNVGADTSSKNQLSNESDIHRSFLSTGLFEIVGNKSFVDNQKAYLVHPAFGNQPYSFGAIFLRNKKA